MEINCYKRQNITFKNIQNAKIGMIPAIKSLNTPTHQDLQPENKLPVIVQDLLMNQKPEKYHALPVKDKLNIVTGVLTVTQGNLFPVFENKTYRTKFLDLFTSVDNTHKTLNELYQGMQIQASPEFQRLRKNYFTVLEKFVDQIPIDKSGKNAILVDFDDTLFKTSQEYYQWIRKNHLDYLFVASPLKDMPVSNSIASAFLHSIAIGLEYNNLEALEGVSAILNKAKQKGVKIILVTAIPQHLQSQALYNLTRGKIPIDETYLRPDNDRLSKQDFKQSRFKEVDQRYNIIASLGDREHDVYPQEGIGFKIPRIL